MMEVRLQKLPETLNWKWGKRKKSCQWQREKMQEKKGKQAMKCYLSCDFYSKKLSMGRKWYLTMDLPSLIYLFINGIINTFKVLLFILLIFRPLFSSAEDSSQTNTHHWAIFTSFTFLYFLREWDLSYFSLLFPKLSLIMNYFCFSFPREWNCKLY